MTAVALPGLEVVAGAVVSPCGRFRYKLWRTWGPARPVLTFCMLNPSTAAGEVESDDATVKKIQRIAARLGYGGIRVVNLFALRSRDPKALLAWEDPIGPGNDAAILAEAIAGNRIVCAWGSGTTGPMRRLIRERVLRVLRILGSYQLYALHECADGEPGHPLYLPDASTLTAWPKGDA